MILTASMTLDYHDYIGSKFTKILCYGNETYNLIKHASLEKEKYVQILVVVTVYT